MEGDAPSAPVYESVNLTFAVLPLKPQLKPNFELKRKKSLVQHYHILFLPGKKVLLKFKHHIS